MASNVEKLDYTEWYENKPIPPRDQWSASNKWRFGGKDVPAIPRDFSICEKCGGHGFFYKPLNRNRKRLTKCDCGN